MVSTAVDTVGVSALVDTAFLLLRGSHLSVSYMLLKDEEAGQGGWFWNEQVGSYRPPVSETNKILLHLEQIFTL